MGNPRVFEVVTGQVLLARRREFVRLHEEIFLPIAAELGITVEQLLIVEVGELGKFFDVYSYASYAEYEEISNELERRLDKAGFYTQVQECIAGSIMIQLASPFSAIRGS